MAPFLKTDIVMFSVQRIPKKAISQDNPVSESNRRAAMMTTFENGLDYLRGYRVATGGSRPARVSPQEVTTQLGADIGANDIAPRHKANRP